MKKNMQRWAKGGGQGKPFEEMTLEHSPAYSEEGATHVAGEEGVGWGTTSAKAGRISLVMFQ